MEVVLIAATLAAGGYAYWRFVWFWRNPVRKAPAGEGVLSAADGTVVYVKTVAPGDEVVSIKRGLAAKLVDLLKEDAAQPKLVIGVFMSPFDVHYNRAPVSGKVEFVCHLSRAGPQPPHGADALAHPVRRPPYYRDSTHIVQNERTVTKIAGCYIVQIAAKTVAGIDSYFKPGDNVQRGAIFGMIRIGSQVDVVLPWRDGRARRSRRPGARGRDRARRIAVTRRTCCRPRHGSPPAWNHQIRDFGSHRLRAPRSLC
jgi:phosphatidylserine decarboxylase